MIMTITYSTNSKQKTWLGFRLGKIRKDKTKTSQHKTRDQTRNKRREGKTRKEKIRRELRQETRQGTKEDKARQNTKRPITWWLPKKGERFALFEDSKAL